MIITDRLPSDVGADELPLYRGRTIGLLRYYFQLALDTGRLPNLLGRELIFRARVSFRKSFTFEDAVLFVHDMQTCLFLLDIADRGMLQTIVLQDHNCHEAAEQLHLTPQAVRRRYLLALDALTRILLDRGILEPLPSSDPNVPSDGKVDIQACADEALLWAVDSVLLLQTATLCVTELFRPVVPFTG